jgi:hypothetical protein
MVEKHYGHMAPSFIVDAIHAGAPRFTGASDTTVVPLRAAKTGQHTGKQRDRR